MLVPDDGTPVESGTLCEVKVAEVSVEFEGLVPVAVKVETFPLE